MNAIDTNLLADALGDPSDARHRPAAEFLTRLRGEDTVLLWQVAIELGALLTRMKRDGRMRGDPSDALAVLRTRLPLVLPGAGVLDLAMTLRARDGVSYRDSLLIAACVEAGVTTLYS